MTTSRYFLPDEPSAVLRLGDTILSRNSGSVDPKPTPAV